MTQPALEKGGSFLSMQPPKGVAVNIDGPNPWQYTAVTVTSTFVALALLFGSIRAYTKVYILRKSSWDDCKPLKGDHELSRQLTKLQ